MTYYEITYRDEDGGELPAEEIHKGCPIFFDGDLYFWISDVGKPIFWHALDHAKAGLSAYQAHGCTAAWPAYEKRTQAMT